MSFFVSRGERAFIAGQTGSGKTENAIYQLQNAPVFPVIIFDTKIEDAFFKLHNPEMGDSMDMVESFGDLQNYSKMRSKDWADYILVRPAIDETQDFDILDSYCRLVYNRFGPATIYYDELYNWHRNGTPTNGFVGLLTRGRSRGKTVIQSTQRPGWISRFCITESQKFYIHNLIDYRDRQTLDAVIPSFSSLALPPKFHFYRFESGADRAAQLYGPVPFTQMPKGKISSRKWL